MKSCLGLLWRCARNTRGRKGRDPLEVDMDSGDDNADEWGPGIAVVSGDRVIRFVTMPYQGNMRWLARRPAHLISQSHASSGHELRGKRLYSRPRRGRRRIR